MVAWDNKGEAEQNQLPQVLLLLLLNYGISINFLLKSKNTLNGTFWYKMWLFEVVYVSSILSHSSPHEVLDKWKKKLF